MALALSYLWTGRPDDGAAYATGLVEPLPDELGSVDEAALLASLEEAGIVAAGMIAHTDPYTATMNALQFFRIDDIVISTLPATRSGWLRADLISRVRAASNKPVEHIAVEAPTKASAAA